MAQVNFFNRKVFKKDLLIVFIIIALPFLFYLYLLVPMSKKWNIIFFNVEFNYFDDAQTFVWTLLTKILTFLILCLWFLTCKHWWRYAIIVPITIECYKIFEVINSDFEYFDNKFLISIPFTLPIILLLLYLANKLNYYSQSINTSAELDEEINELLYELSIFKEENFKSLKENLKKLRVQKEVMNSEDYLKKLIALRDNITKL